MARQLWVLGDFLILFGCRTLHVDPKQFNMCKIVVQVLQGKMAAPLKKARLHWV